MINMLDILYTLVNEKLLSLASCCGLEYNSEFVKL